VLFNIAKQRLKAKAKGKSKGWVMNKLLHLILEGTVACIRKNMKKKLLFIYKVGLLFSLSKYKKIIPISRNITI
jgi:hypothetical protein